jgi:hypothetical protein
MLYWYGERDKNKRKRNKIKEIKKPVVNKAGNDDF